MKLSDFNYSIRLGIHEGIQLVQYDLKHCFDKSFGVRIYSERIDSNGKIKHNFILMDADDLSIPRSNLLELLGEKHSQINCICVFKTEDLKSAEQIKDKIEYYYNRANEIFMVL